MKLKQKCPLWVDVSITEASPLYPKTLIFLWQFCNLSALHRPNVAHTIVAIFAYTHKVPRIRYASECIVELQ